jgi:hypothetical protein
MPNDLPNEMSKLARTSPLVVLALALGAGLAQANEADWPELPTSFPSTGGGGWMITEYRPALDGSSCRTGFVAVSPAGERFENEVVWNAASRNGGVICTAGRWRAKDGSAEGTTPLEVFIKDGVARRAP